MSSNSTVFEEQSSFSKSHMVSSVITFCIIFVILIIYIIIQRFLCGTSRSSLNQIQRGIPDESNPDHHRHSLEFQNRGLEFCIIPSLPMSQFKKSEGEGEEEKAVNTECAICLGEFEEEEWVKKLPSCTHLFHVSCIDTWFQSHSSCPLCRTSVHHYLTLNMECSISSYSSLERLTREDSAQERASHFQAIRSEILHDLDVRQQTSSSI